MNYYENIKHYTTKQLRDSLEGSMSMPSELNVIFMLLCDKILMLEKEIEDKNVNKR